MKQSTFEFIEKLPLRLFVGAVILMGSYLYSLLIYRGVYLSYSFYLKGDLGNTIFFVFATTFFLMLGIALALCVYLFLFTYEKGN